MVIARPDRSCVLTINGGSSSLKFALFPRTAEASARPIRDGRIERIGLAEARAVVAETAGGEPGRSPSTPPTSARRPAG